MSGFNTEKYLFQGFLPIKEKERNQVIKKLLQEKKIIIILETAFRLNNLLNSFSKIWLSNTLICITFNLSCNDEEIFRGTLKKAMLKYENKSKNKKNFVLLINNKN